MVLPLLAHTLLATGTFWTLVNKIGHSLPSVLRIRHLGNMLWYFLCTILAGMWLGEVPFSVNTATLAMKPMEMCLLGLWSCSQLQLMFLGPGWDCQPLGWLLWGTELAVPALHPMTKPVSLHAQVGSSEKTTQTQMHHHPCGSPGCTGVPWASQGEQTPGQCWSMARFWHQPPCHGEQPTALALAGKPGSGRLGCPAPLAGSAQPRVRGQL